jgi:hypothetical protein
MALVLAHLGTEIAFSALLGYALLFFLPVIGGVVAGLPVGVVQWLVLRRHLRDTGSWIVFTLIGFAAAWVAAVIIAAALFVPLTGLTRVRGFLALAIPVPIIGWSQATILRRWHSHPRLWIVASTIGWGGLLTVEALSDHTLPAVNRIAGRIVSGIAGYSVASGIGATVVGGTFAGAVTGIALAAGITLDRFNQREMS